jgi:hypothetical protein
VKSRSIKKIQGTKLKNNNEIPKSYNQQFRSKMQIVTCACGAKILVVPDVAAMDRAIRNHKAEHKNADEGFLISQILEIGSKQVLY